MFLYLAPKKAGVAKKSQQARDREATAADQKEAAQNPPQPIADIDVETPANGGLFANAKISAEALKALTENNEAED